MTTARQIRAAVGTEGATYNEILERTGLDETALRTSLSSMASSRHSSHQMNVVDDRFVLNHRGKRLLERDERLQAAGKPDAYEAVGRPKGAKDSRKRVQRPRRRGSVVGSLFECMGEIDGQLVLKGEDGRLLAARDLVLA